MSLQEFLLNEEKDWLVGRLHGLKFDNVSNTGQAQFATDTAAAIYNSDQAEFEFYQGGAWTPLSRNNTWLDSVSCFVGSLTANQTGSDSVPINFGPYVQSVNVGPSISVSNTGIFTVAAAGCYRVHFNAPFVLGNSMSSSTGTVTVAVMKNGVAVSSAVLGPHLAGTPAWNQIQEYHDLDRIVKCTAGDTLSLRWSTTETGESVTFYAANSEISIQSVAPAV